MPFELPTLTIPSPQIRLGLELAGAPSGGAAPAAVVFRPVRADELGTVRDPNGEYVAAVLLPDARDVGLPVAVEVAGDPFNDRRNATVASRPVPRRLERRAVG